MQVVNEIDELACPRPPAHFLNFDAKFAKLSTNRTHYPDECATQVDAEKLGLPDYHRIVHSPMDLGTVKSNLAASRYAAAAEFAADVRLVAANAIAYSPEADNECHLAARANLAAFEKAFHKAHLSNDGGAATAAAEVVTAT